MSIDTTSPGRHADGTAADGTRIYLDTSGDPVPDAALTAWRHAAVSGGLPEPSRERWQQLRAGVVNMWEFDAAEYWSADGRAQFVGRNEQGKSTMMAMTTLTMLTGDLSARYVDTFGESHRTFRYYLEPTEDPKDRRPTDNQLNRGWTWVEYGRLTETGPEYFTTLLFVQARRTNINTYTKQWVTHTGPERVRDGITLLHQNAVVTASDLTAQPGLSVHGSGKEYVKTIAGTLFGLTDPERLRTVVELLKTLRTPKLGHRLEPGWVIDRIREALPPLAASEVAGLAEGWDQLGQLAADRDATVEAQEAVTAYVRSTWNPWAEATLRLAADDLVAAVTVLDDVTRDERAARDREAAAGQELQQVQDTDADVERQQGQIGQRRETLLRSQSYRDAVAAGGQVSAAEDKVKTTERALGRAATIQQRAHARRDDAQSGHDDADAELANAQSQAATQVTTTTREAAAAGLPAESGTWAADHDTARLETSIWERRNHLREADRLERDASRARTTAERDAELLTGAEKRHTERQKTAQVTGDTFDTEAQRLSDDLETWTETLAATSAAVPPTAADRERWLKAVWTECDQPRPTQRLTSLIRDEWTQPALTPLLTAAATADHDATAARERAADLEAEADRIADAPNPVPATPHNWSRRTRPDASHAGAPLWQLLDPIDDTDTDTVASLEAALAGAGLLDAWVTPDGLWQPDRDGHDHVVALPADTGTVGATLADVLALADPVTTGDLAPLAATARRVLRTVGWRPSADTADGDVWVAADGSWSTPTIAGCAGIPDTGASLLGATARAQARARLGAEHRAEAQRHRTQAADLAATADRHRTAAEELRRLAGQAPRDVDVIGAATERAAADRELDRAGRERDDRARTSAESEAKAAEADARMLTFCSQHNLDPARLDAAAEALQKADVATRALGQAAAAVWTAEKFLQTYRDQLDRALEAARSADAEVEDLRGQRDEATVVLQAARDAMSATDQAVLDEVAELGDQLDGLKEQHRRLTGRVITLSKQQATAEEQLKATKEKREAAERDRTDRLAAWWVLVDAGLAAARGVAAPEDGGRTLTAAVAQARALRAGRRAPRGWPEAAGAGAGAEREQVLSRLRDRLSGAAFLTLNSTLNRTGGRSAVVDHDESTGLPQVHVLVDASNTRLDPNAAITALADKASQLGELHDEQMHKVMEELLASTFVDHLRDKVRQTEELLHDVNGVLGKHPTGTTRTVLRLRRKPVGEHAGGYQVLNRLLEGSVDSPAVQEQVQTFLAGQIRAAQDEAAAEGGDWKDGLVANLDYRRWFAVVTEWRVLSSAKEGATQTWRELTKERHAQDSGGGKVITMLQPLLATLAALYQNSPTAPRPLWLDEAFDGVDAQNTHSLLGMLVDFDFDFVLAGPKAQVASREVPCAAVWMVNRAPAPLPGVDLGLWLYGSGTQQKVELGEQTWRALGAGYDPDHSEDETAPDATSGRGGAADEREALWR